MGWISDSVSVMGLISEIVYHSVSVMGLISEIVSVRLRLQILLEESWLGSWTQPHCSEDVRYHNDHHAVVVANNSGAQPPLDF